MSYGLKRPIGWSQCSKKNLLDYYNWVLTLEKWDYKWCMPGTFQNKKLNFYHIITNFFLNIAALTEDPCIRSELPKCHPANNEFKCCTKDEPCYEGYGGCEEGKGECMDGLKCGKDNCRGMHGGNITILADLDCCYKPSGK